MDVSMAKKIVGLGGDGKLVEACPVEKPNLCQCRRFLEAIPDDRTTKTPAPPNAAKRGDRIAARRPSRPLRRLGDNTSKVDLWNLARFAGPMLPLDVGLIAGTPERLRQNPEP
jgi:hypothetical protein